MIATWMLYLNAAAALIAAGAWVAERGYVGTRRPARHLWAMGMLAVVLLAVWTAVPRPPAPPQTPSLLAGAAPPAAHTPGSEIAPAPAVAREFPVRDAVAALDTPLLVLWSAGSALMAVWLVGGAV